MRLRFHRVHLGLLPLAVAAILVMTALPIEIGAPVEWSWDLRGSDFVANLFLYAPLGVALWRRPIWVIAALCGLLSAVIEASQVWSIDRFPSAHDVISNTAGAVIAALVWRATRPRDVEGDQLVVGPWAACALLIAAGSIVFLWWRPATSSAIAGWDRTYRLQLGNELTGDREWHGVISALAIVPSALSRRELRHLSETPAASWPSVVEDAIDVSTESMTFAGGPSVLLQPAVAEDFVDRASRAQAFTIAARIRSESLSQKGPARIISFSIDPYHRNVDLGQEAEALAFRVRTPVTGLNGEDGYVESSRSLRAGAEMTVAGTYDGTVERLWVDGALVGRLNVAALGCAMPALCAEVEKEAWAGIGVVVTLLGLMLLGSNARAIGISIAAGAIVPLLLYWLHPAPARIASAGWTPALGAVAAIVVGMSVRKPGLVPRSSFHVPRSGFNAAASANEVRGTRNVERH